MLPLLASAVERGEGSASDLAYLTDRVRVKQSLPQVYGTQYDVARDSTGAITRAPDGRLRYLIPVVVDIEGLDERRAAVGLGPWSEYEQGMAELHGRPPVAAPRPDTTRTR